MQTRPNRETFAIHTCPCCKKKFVPAPYHVYKIGDNFTCGWNCLCEMKRRKVETEKKSKLKEKERWTKAIQNAKNTPLESEFANVVTNIVLRNGNKSSIEILTDESKIIRIKNSKDYSFVEDYEKGEEISVRFIAPFLVEEGKNSIVVTGKLGLTQWSHIYELVPSQIIIESLGKSLVASLNGKEFRDDITIIDKRP